MRTNLFPLAAAVLACAAGAQSPLPESGEVALEAKIQRRQKLLLPAETPTPVATGFHFEGGLGADFRADIDGEALCIDADADGTLETRIEGDEGFVVLVSGERRYGARLVKGNVWGFVAGSVVVGELGGTKIQVVDQNHNGRFDDVGVDAMAIGNGRAAGFLSEVVAIDGQLRRITVAPDGSKLTFAPFDGPVGTLSLQANTKGKVLAAVLNSVDGRYSVHVSRHDTELRVPAGDYLLHSGRLSLAGSQVTMERGRSDRITVPADGTAPIAWGGPAKAEFAYASAGTELQFDPNRIWFFGARGEEYKDWNPVGKSPLIVVTDKATGKVVAETRFPGSC